MYIEEKDYYSEKLKYSSEYGLNFDDRIIYVYGILTEELGSILRMKYDLLKIWWKDVEQKSFTDITLDYSSFGGSSYAINAGLDFYYELKNKGILVNTRAQGVCMSATTVLLAGGTGERTSFPKTKFMLHDLQIEGVEGTANQVQHTVKTITDDQFEIFSYYAQFSRKNKEELDEKELKKEARKWQKKFTKDSFDHYISAQEILEMNLIDRIL